MTTRRTGNSMPQRNPYLFLSWGAVFLSVVFLVLQSIGGAVTVSYHPTAPGAYLFPVRVSLAALGCAIYLIMATVHADPSRVSRTGRNLLELAIVPVVLWVALKIYAAAFPEAENLFFSYRGDIYAIPRVYAGMQARETSAYEFLFAGVCKATGEARYGSKCNFIVDAGYTTRSITQAESSASLYLDRAGAVHDDDAVTDSGKLSLRSDERIYSWRHGNSEARYLISEDGSILRFSECQLDIASCRVAVATDRGTLVFPASPDGSADFWREDEARWRAKFDGWRCKEPTCGGQFDAP